MTISRSTLLLVITAAVVLTAIDYHIFSATLIEQARRLDEREIEHDALHALEELSAFAGELHRTAVDYAKWARIYSFAGREHPEYPFRTFARSTINSDRFDLIVLINSSGRVLFSANRGAGADFISPAPQSATKALVRFSAQARVSREGLPLVRLENGHALIAAADVLPSDATGAFRGRLLLAQYLNGPLRDKIQAHMRGAADIIPFGDGVHPQPARANSKPARSRLAVYPAHGGTLQAFLALHDVYDHPALTLRITRSADAYRQVRAAQLLSITLLALSGSFFAALIYFFLRRLVIGRLELLSSQVRRIAESPKHSPLSVSGSDEIAQLTVSLNEMLMRIQQAKAESSAKSAFLAKMNHEIRTPLNCIVMSVNFLKREHQLRDTELFATIERSSKALLQIVNDVLDFSRIEAGKVKLKPAEFTVEQLLNDAINPVRHELQAKRLQLLVHAEKLDRVLFADVGKLAQVIRNLLSNAVNFSPEGANIELALRLADDSGGESRDLLCSVSDEGCGVPAEKQDPIFECFEQADQSSSRSAGGAGLGLSICRELIKLMNGRIWVQSECGRGSKFSFTARVGIRTPLCAAGDLEDDAAVKGLLGRHFLVAEDQRDAAVLIRRVLTEAGACVELASNGCEAIESFRNGTFDAVLMDCWMPEMDGFQAASAIRSIETTFGLPAVPIIAVTADAVTGIDERCRAAGMNDCLIKPFNPAGLIAILRYLEPGSGGREQTIMPEAVAY